MTMTADEFHDRWFGDCSECDAKDEPIFCSIGMKAVCVKCFLAAIKKSASQLGNAVPDSQIKE